MTISELLKWIQSLGYILHQLQKEIICEKNVQSDILERLQSNEGKDAGKIINSEGGRERGRQESSGHSILKINQFSPLGQNKNFNSENCGGFVSLTLTRTPFS